MSSEIIEAEARKSPQSLMEALLCMAAVYKNNGVMDQLDFQEFGKWFNKMVSETGAEMAYSIASADIAQRYSFVKVDALASAPSLHVWYKDNKRDDVYRPLSDDTAAAIMTEYYKLNRLGRLSNKINTAVQTLKNEVTAHVKQVSDRVIRVSRDMYYDTKTGGLYRSPADIVTGGDGPDDTAICFRSLFESTNSNINARIDDVMFSHYEVDAFQYFYAKNQQLPSPDNFVTEFTEFLNDPESDFAKSFGDEAKYKAAVEEIEPYIESYLKPLKFVWETADHVLDRYNDLIKTLMLEFQYVKIGFIFYFIGEKINGKTSFQLCRRFMLGENNCTQLTMPQLTSWDHSLEVAKTMSNIPTEDCDLDDDSVEKDLGMIKCIATHESIALRMKNQPTGITFTPNFLSFFPRNKNPDFGGGDGLQAFASRRLKIIHFTHDFSTAANNGVNFETETFTSSFYSSFLPMLLGMARYYIGKKVTFSADCDSFTEQIGSMIDPVSNFMSRLYYWFDGVGSLKFVTDQAVLHFKHNGVQITKDLMASIKGKLARLDDYKARYVARKQQPTREYITEVGARCRGKRTPKPIDGHDRMMFFSPNSKLEALGGKSPEEYYSSTNPDSVDGDSMPSIIDILDDMMFDAREDGKELNLVARQSAMESLDRRTANATYDEKNNLVDENGDILNGLL